MKVSSCYVYMFDYILSRIVGYIRVCEQSLRVLVLQVGQEDGGT